MNREISATRFARKLIDANFEAWKHIAPEGVLIQGDKLRFLINQVVNRTGAPSKDVEAIFSEANQKSRLYLARI